MDYESDFNALKGATHQNIDGIWNINKGYWLASRNIDSTSTNTAFNVRCVGINTISMLNKYALWSVQSSGNTTPKPVGSGVRVVITLKSGIKTSNGTGGSGSPYELVP